MFLSGGDMAIAFMSSDLVFWHRYFSVRIFDKLPLWRQALSFFVSLSQFLGKTRFFAERD